MVFHGCLSLTCSFLLCGVQGAAVAPTSEGEQFPVVVFSHGLAGNRVLYR